MKDYTKFMKWAVVYMIDRKTQDDRKSKVEVEALFSSLVQAKDNYIIRNPEHKRYIIHVDDLEEFETVYNQFQDLREKYGEHAIFHLDDLALGCDKENKYRYILNIDTDIDFQSKRSPLERQPRDGLPALMMADHNEESEVLNMEKIVEWLKSCGYSESEAVTEANKMIDANRWDGTEMCSHEYAIEMILDNLIQSKPPAGGLAQKETEEVFMIIKASDIKVGTQLAEADGFLFDVVEIVKQTEKTITVRLCSDFSSFPAHWRTKKDGTPGGIIKTFRKSSQLYCVDQ